MARYALVVGISEYRSRHLSNLSKPVGDAEEIAALLDRYGRFETKPKVLKGKVTQSQLVKTLQTFLEKKAENADAFIYFTGHGISVKDPFEDQGQGCLATSDTEIKVKDGKVVSQENAIPFTSLDKLIQKANLSSLIMMIDACHSGNLVSKAAYEQSFLAFNNKPDCLLISACRDFEEALAKKGEDNSLFTSAVLKVLTADNADRTGAITSGRLADELKLALKGSPQEPEAYGKGLGLKIIEFPPEERVNASLNTSGSSNKGVTSQLLWIAENEEEFFSLLRRRCCEQNQACNKKTQLFTKEHIDLEQVYVPSVLMKVLRSQSLIADNKISRVSINEALESCNHIAIIGPPGIGKSTILNYLFIQECIEPSSLFGLTAFESDENRYTASQGKFLPILIRIREVSSNRFDLIHELERILHLPYEQTEFVLHSGRLLLLIDGLDEISQDFRETVCEEINNLARSYQQTKIILTCRSAVPFYPSESFNFFEVASLSKKQQDHFVKNYFSLALGDTGSWLRELLDRKEVSSQQLQWKIQSSVGLRELAQTPLLLSMICIVYMRSGVLPEKKSALYEQGVDIYLRKWDQYRASQSRSQSELYRGIGSYQKQEILEELAYYKFSQESGYTQFSEKEAVSLIAEHIDVNKDESTNILKGIASDHGFLIETSSGQWEFSHLTFHEYFVAQRILTNREWDVLTEKITDDKWREVIQLVVESAPLNISWFKRAREKVDSMVTENSYLAALLESISSKAEEIVSSDKDYPYALAATRAFYYELEFNFSLINKEYSSFHSNWQYELPCLLDGKMRDALEVIYEMDHISDVHSYIDEIEYYEDLEESHGCYPVRSPETSTKIEEISKEVDKLLTAYRDLSRELHKTLLYDSSILEDIIYMTNALRIKRGAVERIRDYSAFSSNTLFSRHEHRCTPVTDLSREYRDKLSSLLDKLSSLQSDSELVDWVGSIISLLRKGRNIAHIHLRDDEQRAQAQKYYKANLFFIKMLEKVESVSSADKTTLKESLFLSTNSQ